MASKQGRIRRWRRKRRELYDALQTAYSRGDFTFLDLCIALNELDVAYERLSALKPLVDVARTSFKAGDHVGAGEERGIVKLVEPDRIIVEFTSFKSNPRPPRKKPVVDGEPRCKEGTHHGQVFTKTFKPGERGSWINGHFRGHVLVHSSMI